VQVIQNDLKSVGIKITPENLSSTTYDNDVYNGKYQLAYDGNESGGPAPYYELRQLLYSKNSAPIGKPAASNWERYSNAKTDALTEQYGATTDAATQHKIVKQLEAVMVNEIPVIPVTEAVDWYQYNTKDLAGWVVKGNPFAEQDDHKKLLVMFLASKPAAAGVKELDGARIDGEEFEVVGQEVYMHYPNGYGRAKRTGAFVENKLAVAGTARNWKSVTTLAEMAAG